MHLASFLLLRNEEPGRGTTLPVVADFVVEVGAGRTITLTPQKGQGQDRGEKGQGRPCCAARKVEERGNNSDVVIEK
jgi:hypothetical protein